ncbi:MULTISPECIES: NADPH-dependent FMN reductase [unclassified Halomonas]|uniref:NADPH-dependent FMN reductase n=1 Tax=unclassified Halomonas TaxID=2609666 RepID=UPI0020A03C10|nr:MULTISPECIES: NADPH-dependent FMN reductase [unclassified Halomonas]MCP1313882.1 NADPH-dependent FMN reductase [Halomonas sp. 707D7]MCP1326530.1 NADPH-dependent FMN reductase [Halomonas sp. 707D4]
MSIVLIAGSPGSVSRTSALIAFIEGLLEARGFQTDVFDANEFDGNAVFFADVSDPQVVRYREAIAKADAVILATPVYQASFSGALKGLLDLVPQRGLKGKVVLPLATGGSDSHLLVIDYAMKPVLSALGASNVLSGVYVSAQQLIRETVSTYRVEEEASTRIQRALDELIEALPPAGAASDRANPRAAYA